MSNVTDGKSPFAPGHQITRSPPKATQEKHGEKKNSVRTHGIIIH